MPRRVADDDDWDDEDSTVPCPYCRQEIHEDSPRCPHCGNYISEEDTAPAHKPWWLLVGVLLCLYAVYRWIVP
jgi:transposase-like protein